MATKTKAKPNRAVTSADAVGWATDPKWLRTRVAESLGVIEELSGYLSLLEAARDQKAKMPETSAGFEREVLANARRAERNTRRLLGGTLSILTHLKTAGFMDHALKRCATEMEKRGKLSFAEYWRELAGDEQTTARFHRAGISARTLDQLSDAATRMMQTIEFRDGNLTVLTDSGLPVVIKSRSLLGGTITDALFVNQFEAAAEQFERTDVLVGDVLARSHADEHENIDPYQAFLGMSLSVQRRVTEHVRKLEDTGLAVYEGNDPVDALFIIGAILIVAAILVAIVCERTDAEGDVCDMVSSALATLGFAFEAAACVEDPTCDVVVQTMRSVRTRGSDGVFGFGR